MTVAAYNTAINPIVYYTLATELKAVFSNPDGKLEYTKLEKLQYLVCSPFYWKPDT